jgi:SAM-dependent methyltransferase
LVANRDYVEVIYNERDRPFTSYPGKLARYLTDRYALSDGSRILEIGCGRGEFLNGFIDCGLVGHGVDLSSVAIDYCPDAEVKIADLERDGIPYSDRYFDVVYSKSVVEHFYYPESVVSEMFRVLRPGGMSLILTPDWHVNYRMFYCDYTHRTPFTVESLRDLLLIQGFTDVSVERFRQLPVVWKHPRVMLPLTEITRWAAPRAMKRHSKWVRFSKEVMLLASAKKPS